MAKGDMKGMGGMHGRGHMWQRGIHGRGYAWKGSMHGRGVHGWGMHGGGGVHGRGIHGRGHSWQGACMATAADGTHPTAMYSCIFQLYILMLFLSQIPKPEYAEVHRRIIELLVRLHF